MTSLLTYHRHVIFLQDDCILYRDISSAADAIILQEDFNKLAKTWGMYFSGHLYNAYDN